MFLTELTPALQELSRQPLAFLGGFCSGIFRLQLQEEPLKSWLEKQGIDTHSPISNNNGKGNAPQSIAIE